LCELVPSHEAELHRALALLVAKNKLRTIADETGVRYAATECVIGANDPFGWEAAMFDHYQAMVQALCARLARGGNPTNEPREGGSTYTYVISEEHPMRGEVLGFLSGVRRQAEELRKRVVAYNRDHPEAIETPLRVTTYVGQSSSMPSLERETSLS